MKRCVSERYDKVADERGQHNKQGSMGEEANQLYLRHKMTGQVMDEEDERSESHRPMRNINEPWLLETIIVRNQTSHTYK